jgi:predicted ABC-type ATPase
MNDLSKLADSWVRSNRKKLIAKFCSGAKSAKGYNPTTIFMAGTPGAGKTEFSIKLIESFRDNIVRIDADEIRQMMREIGYNGANAEIFQHASTKGVNKIYDEVLKKNYNAIVDGTFAYGNWRENVERSLQKSRIVEIYYLYQDPLIAWDFVKKREKNQGRAVPMSAFLESYQKSIDNVQKAIEVFGKNITVYFAKNNYTKNVEYIEVDVNDIDKLLPARYTKEELKQVLYARKDNNLQSR